MGELHGSKKLLGSKVKSPSNRRDQVPETHALLFKIANHVLSSAQKISRSLKRKADKTRWRLFPSFLSFPILPPSSYDEGNRFSCFNLVWRILGVCQSCRLLRDQKLQCCAYSPLIFQPWESINLFSSIGQLCPRKVDRRVRRFSLDQKTNCRSSRGVPSSNEKVLHPL